MLPQSLQKLIFEFSKLPSVGERSAYRIAYHLINKSEVEINSLTQAILNAKSKLQWCKYCFGMADDEVCSICLNSARIRDQLCVVERPADIFALERSGAYRGIYHVLHGVWSPLKRIRPEDLKIRQLIDRLDESTRLSGDPLLYPLKEVILATSTTVEGDATATYLANALDSYDLVITRLAQGLPKGGEIEFADEVTIGMSFSGRRGI